MTSTRSTRHRLALVAAAVLGALLVPTAEAGVGTGPESWTEFTAWPAVSITPDTNTLVYQAIYSAGPEHETVIRGHAPTARYWSFAILDPARREIANISDYEIRTDPTGAYEVHVRFGCGDTPNCLDASRSAAPGVPDRILYRLYVPEQDPYGGTALPDIEYRRVDDETTIQPPIPSDLVQELLWETSTPLRPGGAVHDALAAPTGLARPVEDDNTGDPPTVERFQGLGAAQVKQLEEVGTPQPLVDAANDARGQGGFGATQDNAYVTVAYAARFGNLHIRAKAPTYARQSTAPANHLGRPTAGAQTRYWSLCTVQGTRPVDCVRDEHVHVSPDGYFDILIAPECPDRTPGVGVTCLRMGAVGGSANGSLIYRNLLARQDFANQDGPHECPSGPSQFCGAYALSAQYVPRS